jgi:rare lipoprotein A
MKYLLLLLLATSLHANTASWYGKECEGNYTANMEVFDPWKYTCASWHYPFNTMLKVTNTANGKYIVVRVNDRGPNKRLNRAIDLSMIAFKQIADLETGLINVRIEKL